MSEQMMLPAVAYEPTEASASGALMSPPTTPVAANQVGNDQSGTDQVTTTQVTTTQVATTQTTTTQAVNNQAINPQAVAQDNLDTTPGTAVSVVSMTVISDVSLTAGDIRNMAQELSDARRVNTFPPTAASPMNAQVTVEDYGFLQRLRQLRGDPTVSPPHAYLQLYVENARRIKERDATIEDDEIKAEAARRVTHYLNTIEHEQDAFRSATSAPTTPSGSVVGGSTQIDAESFTEEVLSIIEQVADATLMDATEPLRHHKKVMAVLNKCLREDAFDLKARIQTLGGQNDVYARLLQKHDHACLNIIYKLEVHEESLRTHEESLRQVTGDLGAHAQVFGDNNQAFADNNQAFADNNQALSDNNQALADNIQVFANNNQTLGDHAQVSANNNQVSASNNQISANNNQSFNQHLLVASQQQQITGELINCQRDVLHSLRAMASSQGHVNQLSAVVAGLPAVIDAAVARAAQQQVQTTLHAIMEAQQLIAAHEAKEHGWFCKTKSAAKKFFRR